MERDPSEPTTDPGAMAPWPDRFPDHQWELYREAIAELRNGAVPFLLGGAFGFAAHTGIWRNTKDLDLYVLPRDRDAAVEALGRAGFADYHPEKPYDRRWIYRSHRDGVILDIIWSMANLRASVDEAWFRRARPVRVREEELLAVPAEELIWSKLYIVQRDRCDWPDILNVLQAAGPTLDWDHLLGRVGGDGVLLAGVLSVFRWLCRDEAGSITDAVIERARRAGEAAGAAGDGRRRADLLDSRAWFPYHQGVAGMPGP